MPALLPDYKSSVGAILNLLKEYVGHEIGDPAKIAQVIVDLTRRERLPAHLLLGSDALFVCDRAEEARRQEAAEWREVSTSTDFPGTDLSFLNAFKR